MYIDLSLSPLVAFVKATEQRGNVPKRATEHKNGMINSPQMMHRWGTSLDILNNMEELLQSDRLSVFYPGRIRFV